MRRTFETNNNNMLPTRYKISRVCWWHGPCYSTNPPSTAAAWFIPAAQHPSRHWATAVQSARWQEQQSASGWREPTDMSTCCPTASFSSADAVSFFWRFHRESVLSRGCFSFQQWIVVLIRSGWRSRWRVTSELLHNRLKTTMKRLVSAQGVWRALKTSSGE